MQLRSQNKLIAHVDMNSFFASAEQQANPFLRGKPLGVCAYLHPHGCVIAASIEAKQVGVKVGMSVTEARQQCRQMVFIENDPAKYRAISSRVFSLLQAYTDRLEVYSIDEAFLDLTYWYRDAAEAAWALTQMRQRLLSEIGEWLRCSIGIAPTRFLAKTASDLEKPNGLVIIDQDNLDAILQTLVLEDFCGIGPRLRRRLERLGIRTPLELKKYPVANLMRVFGKQGFYLWSKLQGIEYESVTPREALPQSIGHSYCVPRVANHEGKIVAIIARLTERAGRRLRKHGLFANAISVAVGFRFSDNVRPKGPFWDPRRDGEGGGRETMRLHEPVQDSFTLVSTACQLLERMWHGEEVNFLAVTLLDVSEPTEQIKIASLGEAKRDREQRASVALDAVRDRYGDGSIMFGSMLKLQDEAPDRVGFRKIEGVDVQVLLNDAQIVQTFDI